MKNGTPLFHGFCLKDQEHGTLLQVAGWAGPREYAHLACSLQEWHNILGHLSPQTIQKMAREGSVDGLDLTDTNTDFDCEACVQGKMSAKPIPKVSTSDYTKVGQLVVTDVFGPTHTQSLQGCSYYVSFTNVASHYKKVYFMAHKNEAFKFYKQFEAMVEMQTGAKLKTVQFDNGKEYVNREFLDYMSSCGTIHQVTSPHTPQQNGIAERLNRTLMEKCHTMIFQSGLPKSLGQEAVAYACFISNRVPTLSHKGYISPYEAFHGKRPDLTQLQTFGTPCHVLDQSGNRGKLDPKTKPGTFVGIAENQGYSFGYILPGGKQVLHSRNVAFPKHAKIADVAA
ncbi:hypothetical protein FRC06_010482 [Ceratobasidium sp. 370]|nr:hypothetical protein FRC06_010482 [Ceratobasidium sp. 370]